MGVRVCLLCGCAGVSVVCVCAVAVDELTGKQAYLLFYKRATSPSQQQDRAALLRQCSLREVSSTPASRLC